MRHITRLLTGLILALGTAMSQAAEVRAAVAANFTAPFKEIAAAFEKATGHTVTASYGPSGVFYTQISNGAPFDVFLSADNERPAQLEKDGAIVPGSRFTYAKGTLVLWSSDASLVGKDGAALKKGWFTHIAIANPAVAPYGAAGMQVLGKLGLTDKVTAKIVQGTDISQTLQFVKTGNAELGFVALSQVWKNGALTSGSAWLPPAELYDPILQDAVMLANARDKAASAALLEWLKRPESLKIIKAYGYQ